MAKLKLPNSTRKFLRRQKSEIRRRISNTKEADREIKVLVEKTFAVHTRSRGAHGEKASLPSPQK